MAEATAHCAEFDAPTGPGALARCVDHVGRAFAPWSRLLNYTGTDRIVVDDMICKARTLGDETLRGVDGLPCDANPETSEADAGPMEFEYIGYDIAWRPESGSREVPRRVVEGNTFTVTFANTLNNSGTPICPGLASSFAAEFIRDNEVNFQYSGSPTDFGASRCGITLAGLGTTCPLRVLALVIPSEVSGNTCTVAGVPGSGSRTLTAPPQIDPGDSPCMSGGPACLDSEASCTCWDAPEEEWRWSSLEETFDDKRADANTAAETRVDEYIGWEGSIEAARALDFRTVGTRFAANVLGESRSRFDGAGLSLCVELRETP